MVTIPPRWSLRIVAASVVTPFARIKQRTTFLLFLSHDCRRNGSESKLAVAVELTRGMALGEQVGGAYAVVSLSSEPERQADDGRERVSGCSVNPCNDRRRWCDP